MCRTAATASSAAEDLCPSAMYLAEAQRLTIELKHPIAAAILRAQTCALWLGRDAPNLTAASDAASEVVKALKQASTIIERVSSLSDSSASE